MYTSKRQVTNQAAVISLPTTTMYLCPDVAHLSRRRSKGWWCNLCNNYKLSSIHPHQIVVKQNNKSQFEIMVKLIENENCEVIFYDCDLTKQQSLYLENLTKNKTVRLVNAKELHLPNQKIA